MKYYNGVLYPIFAMRNLYPTEEQLQKINQLKPVNQPDYAAEELIVLAYLASNNLIHGSMVAWSIDALRKIAASYQKGGQDLMLDHKVTDSQKVFGMIFDSELYHIPVPSPDLIQYLLHSSPSPQEDRKILLRNGYYYVINYAVVEASNWINSDIRYLRKSDVSIGGHLYQADMLCPICSEELGQKVSFLDKRCPHYMPGGYSDVEEDKIAPYAIRDGSPDMSELSMVAQGNCVQAKIVTEQMINLLP